MYLLRIIQLFSYVNVLVTSTCKNMYLFIPCMEYCGHANCLHIPFDREESNERKQ